MIQDAFWGILIPFLGTSLGAGCVFFLKNSLRDGIQRALTGFAAGVMVAVSVWSLLIPAMEQAADLGRLAFFPAAVGFWLGILFLLLLDHLIPHLHQNSLQAEGPKSQLQRTTMMVLAVTLHNIPEGMAVGVVYAGYLAGTAQITAAGALALSLGIAIQNFPEGAIISMPLRAEGMKKGRAFWGGVLSGIVEPIGAVLTILAAGIVVPALPYLLSFAAGAMLYVVVEELIPMSSGSAQPQEHRRSCLKLVSIALKRWPILEAPTPKLQMLWAFRLLSFPSISMSKKGSESEWKCVCLLLPITPTTLLHSMKRGIGSTKTTAIIPALS